MVECELRILVVDDNEGCRELYTLWLGDQNVVQTASNGKEAMETLDAQVDIVLLDRDMPGPSGSEVAREIAASEHDPYVVMVSSMSAEFDLVEFPIDGYLQKPVSEEEVEGVIEQYRAQQAYQAALDDFFSLTAKMAAIEAHKSDDELADSEEYARLTERVAAKRREVDEALASARADWVATFKTCMDDVDGVTVGVELRNGYG